MRKEIGSEFSAVCTNSIQSGGVNWLPGGEDYAFVFSGRTAIETVLRDIGNNGGKVLLPSYCCESMIEPFLIAGYSVAFYGVGVSDGISVSLNIPEDCLGLLLCNYFGFHADWPKEEIHRFRARGGVVIEDITHSLFSEKQVHLESDYCVASLRKWGALFSGGYCSKRKGCFAEKPKQEPPAEFLWKKADAMALKEEYLRDGNMEKKNRYLKLFSESNQWLAEHWPDLAMDAESKRLLTGWDAVEIRAIRRRNAEILYQGLSECHGIFPLFPLDKMDCPLFVPVYVESEKRDEVRRRMIEAEIYCPVHWPVSELHWLDARTRELYDTELSLVCDQRYNSADMKRICDTLKEIFNRS